MTALPEAAEVVVVGGGVVGASVAFHLARAGVRDVLLVERGRCGEGSSGKPVGGVRAQFSDALNVQLAARSLAAYEAFGTELGVDIGLDQVGYLFLLREPQDAAGFAEAAALQASFGVETRMLTPAEAHARCPPLDPEAFVGAAFSPRDGHARPDRVVAGYLAAAGRLGVTVAEDCAVDAIDCEGGEITGVRTARGTVRTTTVVCAAGAWSREIGAMAGVDLDVEPLRRQIALTAPAPELGRVPFTIDYATTFYFHAAGDGLLLGMTDRGQVPGFDTDYGPEWLPELRALAAGCAPALAGLEVRQGWAGLYEQTPDANALIGEAPHVGRFLYATGFSGHGFCQAPAAGEIVADLVRGRAPFADVHPLRAERFAERAPVLEANIV